MSIFPLPVFEADADPRHRSTMSDEEIYARLEAPKTVVVKFGYLKQVGEFPYEGDVTPGCGSKLIARTTRGTELVEMLTTTCSNSGCGKSISRHEMLDYIENSGGRDYPFHSKGRVLRVATIEDMNKQSALDANRKDYITFAKAQIVELNLQMKLVEVEFILGGELVTFYYMSEERVDFRELVTRLAAQFKTRIEMRQVGARDEARLVADYERCGQHCCCKNFLKVLKPVSMRAAKVQKATLDPLKISGRCGRLMCCLRYEDQTYKELKSNLPPRNKRVGTSEGPGLVVDSKILVQLVLVRLEHDPTKEIAVPVEELMDPEKCPKPRLPGEPRQEVAVVEPQPDPLRGLAPEQVQERTDDDKRRSRRKRRRGKRGGGERPDQPRTKDQQQDEFRRQAQARERDEKREQTPGHEALDSDDVPGQPQRNGESTLPPPGQPGDQPRRKRRRRRRRRGGGGGGGQGGGGGGGGPAPDSGG